MYETIVDAATRIRTGALSPVDLVRECLDRIGRLDRDLHAFITVTADTALDQAREAERAIRDGHWLGPLHGIPIAHKDIVCTAGVRTTAHSRLLLDFVPSENATVYERLRAAGAISLGKTSLHEFAYGNPVPDEPFPAARNPWNLAHAPGSSSSGSGAAVAAGLCMGAVGTDTGGSIRHPAAVCGIVGMKPTYGRVSSFGVLPLASSLDHAGPMTRTVRDNAIMLQAMAGHDARDPTSVDRPVPDFNAAIGKDIRGLRIGVPRRFQASVPHDSEVLDAFEAALGALRDLGVVLCDIEVDGLDDAETAGSVLLIREAWLHHRADLERAPGLYGASFRARVAPGATFTDAQLRTADETRTRLRRGYDAVFATGIDAIVSTARENPADTMASLYADTIGRRPATNRMYNMTGMPAVAMPMGFTRAGLPVGLQFAGPLWSEPLLYRIAAAYEDTNPWHERHPLL